MKVKPICKHRVLAGFCTVFVLVCLIISGTFFALRGGIFSGTNIKELMEVNGIDKQFEEFCGDIIDEEFQGEDIEWLVESEYYDDVKSEMAEVFLESFFERQDSVNLDGVVDEIMAAVEAETDSEAAADFDVEEFEAEMEASFNEMLDEYYGSEAFEGMENLNYYLGVGTVMINVVAFTALAMAVLFMFILCVLYKESIFGAFSKLAIASGVAGIFILLTGILKYFIKFILNEVTGEELKKAAVDTGMDILEFLNKLMDLMFDPFIYVGVILFATMIVSIVVYNILKKSFIDRQRSQMDNVNNYRQGM